MATGGLRLLLRVQFSHALGQGHSEALKFRKRLASGLFCAPPGRPALWLPPGTALQARPILPRGPMLPLGVAGRSLPACTWDLRCCDISSPGHLPGAVARSSDLPSGSSCLQCGTDGIDPHKRVIVAGPDSGASLPSQRNRQK